MKNTDPTVAKWLNHDLLKRTLMNRIHNYEEFTLIEQPRAGELLGTRVYPAGTVLVRSEPFDKEKQTIGQDVHAVKGMLQ